MCRIPLVQKITELSDKDQRMAQLHDRLQEYIEYIKTMNSLTEEDIYNFVGQDSVNAYHLENICNIATTHVACIETQFSIHELALQVLEAIKYKTITEEANTWETYISSMEGPT